MAIPNLDDLTASLDATAAAYLGDLITYTPEGQAALDPFRAFVNYADGMTDLGAGQAVEQDIMVHIPKVSRAAQPVRGDRITLPRRPGKTYYPTNPSTDDSGTHWVCALKEVR